MSDEEKKVIEFVKSELEDEKKARDDYQSLTGLYGNLEIEILLNLIEKQSKEIEELKEDRKNYTEEYIHNNPWLYKQLNENYILRVESEQKERKAYIKGTNDAHELCNKKWKDKIKAKIEEIDEVLKGQLIEKIRVYFEAQKEVLQSLLKKE